MGNNMHPSAFALLNYFIFTKRCSGLLCNLPEDHYKNSLHYEHLRSYFIFNSVSLRFLYLFALSCTVLINLKFLKYSQSEIDPCVIEKRAKIF
jgi:hypothetical protein